MNSKAPSSPFPGKNLRWQGDALYAGLLVLVLWCLTACTSARPVEGVVPPGEYTLEKPKNVILLIGDGMGLPQITGAMYMNNNKTVFEEFKNIGFHKSNSSDNLVTDSAAGATAFASGVKTYNGAVGVNARKEPVTTILEMAEKKGMATGIVVSCSVTHATPASFYAHVPSRDLDEQIALGFLDTPIDILIGGGMDYFARRKDERDLIAALTDKGYAVSNFFDRDIHSLNIQTDKNIAYFTANAEPLPTREGRDYLIPASLKAISFLKDRSPAGFFLMIEGAQIDWGGHANDANYVITEMLEFEKVVAEVLAFARKDGNTLVVITGDHETGGFAVQPGSKLNKIEVAFTTKSHTALMIPVFAEGPGAEAYRGIYENTAIFQKLKLALGL